MSARRNRTKRLRRARRGWKFVDHKDGKGARFVFDRTGTRVDVMLVGVDGFAARLCELAVQR
jgi:hypothetical protein